MTTIRTVYRPGTRVVLTAHAIRSGLQGRARSPRGRVVRALRSSSGQLLIAVKRPGVQTVSTFSPLWWRRVVQS